MKTATPDSSSPRSAARRRLFVVGRNYITEEVELITSSSGDVFEEKKKRTRKNVRTQKISSDAAGQLTFMARRLNAEAAGGTNGKSAIDVWGVTAKGDREELLRPGCRRCGEALVLERH